MRDQIMAKLIAKRLVKGPNRWTMAGFDFLEDFVCFNFDKDKPNLYAEKLAEQVFNLFGPSARIVVDRTDKPTSKIAAIFNAAEEPTE